MCVWVLGWVIGRPRGGGGQWAGQGKAFGLVVFLRNAAKSALVVVQWRRQRKCAGARPRCLFPRQSRVTNAGTHRC